MRLNKRHQSPIGSYAAAFSVGLDIDSRLPTLGGPKPVGTATNRRRKLSNGLGPLLLQKSLRDLCGVARAKPSGEVGGGFRGGVPADGWEATRARG